MAIGFPVKADYATGDVLTAANMNDLAGTLNTVPNTIGAYAAGKNVLINGDLRINQYGFTSTTAGGYTFDRFALVLSGDGTTTTTAQTFTAGAAPVAGYEAINFVRMVTTGQTSTTVRSTIQQRIEDVRTLAGQTVTFSVWARAGSGTPSIAFEFAQNFGSGGSATVTAIGATKRQISTSWERYSMTVTMPSISGKTIGTNSKIDASIWVSAGSNNATRSDSLGIQSNTFDLWGFQIEAGSTATPFQTATGTIQGELAACKRYFKTYRGDATYTFMQLPTGINLSTTRMIMSLPFDVSMRSVPTVTISNLKMGYSGNVITAAGINQMSNDNGSFSAAGLFFDVALGQIAGAAEFVYGNNSASAKLDLSSEL